MRYYYALIRRSDFIDLFKYGQFHLNFAAVVDAGNSDKSSNEKESILTSLFKDANSFESSFAYLIIKFASDNFNADSPIVNIEEVTNVYPLDYEAKREFEGRFDTHIRIDGPIWSDSYAKEQRLRTKRDCEKGAINVWKLFNPQTQISECKDIITDDILNEVVSELYENRRPSGDLSIWVYLLRYERHAYYPQEVVGYFMDTVNIVCNYLSHNEVDEVAVSRTAIWSFLDRLPREYKMKEILNALEKSDETVPFISKVSQIEGRVEFIKVAVAFLMLKTRYSDGLRYEAEYIKNLAESKNTGKYYGLIAYLLGLVLGRDKTYECLYENLPLQIYKGKAEMERIRKRQKYDKMKASEDMKRMEEEQQIQKSAKYKGNGGGSKTATLRKPNYGRDNKSTDKGSRANLATEVSAQQIRLAEQSDGTLFPGYDGNTTDVRITPNLPCVMGKFKKGTTEFCEKPKPKTVYTQEEFMALSGQGWSLMNK